MSNPGSGRRSTRSFITSARAAGVDIEEFAITVGVSTDTVFKWARNPKPIHWLALYGYASLTKRELW